MTLLDLKTSIFDRTGTTATSFPAANMVVSLNVANEKVLSRIRPFMDCFRPTPWTTSDLSTGTATPVFDSYFHDLLSLYVSIDRAGSRALPNFNQWVNRATELETQLDLFYAQRNYQPFTVTIAAPGVVTKINHGLLTNDRVTLITTGALPTGLSVDTPYFITVVDCDTFKLTATKNGTAITTTGTQSGTHYYSSDRAKHLRPGYQNNK